jgi:hypothetical protein
LVRHPSVRELLARIDTSAGCSIKDSFATLDLGAYGFSVLFDAQWIVRPATEVAPTSTGLAWEVIREPEDLTRWERVWRGDDGPEGLFRPELLTNDAVVFLAARRHDQVAAGAVLNRASNAVVGISNMFSDALDVAACWSDCIATASSMFSGATLVGYESGEMLESARAHGFEATGALRVWVSDG